MKNDTSHHIRISRSPSNYRVVRIDIMRDGQIVKNNYSNQRTKPKRKRRINYEKKIMNDSFIFDA